MTGLAARPIDTVRMPADIAATLVNPKAYADRRLHDAFTWLRANNPVGLAAPEGFEPFWAITKHADILEVSRQNALFCSGRKQVIVTTKAADAKIRAINNGDHNIIRSLVSMDAPDHPKFRALTQAWFLPQNIAKLEARIREIARRAVERLAARGGRCDFVTDVALGFPLHVVMNIMGVPEADEPRMLMLTQQIFGPQDPDMAREGGQQDDPAKWAEQLAAIFADFSGFFSAISADRRAHPREDLATVIANATVNGEPIAERDAMSYYIIVATAGHDTTSSSTAGAMWALAEDPALFARVKNDPALIPGLVDEAIRWTTPVKHFMRTATADAEIGGRRIAKDDWLMLCYASGNRDEDVFEAPFEFRPERKPNKHLAFGYGAHLCLGQHLAKMEMRILFEELFPRLRSVALDGEPRNSESSFVNGPKTVPIRFELA